MRDTNTCNGKQPLDFKRKKDKIENDALPANWQSMSKSQRRWYFEKKEKCTFISNEQLPEPKKNVLSQEEIIKIASGLTEEMKQAINNKKELTKKHQQFLKDLKERSSIDYELILNELQSIKRWNIVLDKNDYQEQAPTYEKQIEKVIRLVRK
jgi:arsenate reductase-like glutaredoxin family protein